MKPIPYYCCLASSPLNQKPCPSSVVVSSQFFLYDSESPMMSNLYWSNAYVSSVNFLHLFKVRTFSVLIVRLSFGSLMRVVCLLLSCPCWSVWWRWLWKGLFLASIFVVFLWAFDGNQGLLFILQLNFTLSCSHEASPECSWDSPESLIIKLTNI